jgi:hypothetical protein
MNWDEVGAIGQVLGSIAVFITLVYLSVQTRHARSEARRAASQSNIDGTIQIHMTVATDVQLSSALVKADLNLGAQPSPFVATLMEQGVSQEEAYRVSFYYLAQWALRTQRIRYIREFSEDSQMDFDVRMRRNYGSTGSEQLWYRKSKDHLNTDFVRYIDNLLAQPG